MFCNPLPPQLLSKIDFFSIFWNEVDLPHSYLDNVFKYPGFFFTLPLSITLIIFCENIWINYFFFNGLGGRVAWEIMIRDNSASVWVEIKLEVWAEFCNITGCRASPHDDHSSYPSYFILPPFSIFPLSPFPSWFVPLFLFLSVRLSLSLSLLFFLPF